MKQINNLKIKHIKGEPNTCYKVVTPDNRVLEEFGTYGNAVRCAKSIKDFTIRK
jgi:hypothetical protein